jgi:hypothetical protein
MHQAHRTRQKIQLAVAIPLAIVKDKYRGKKKREKMESKKLK